MHQTNNAVGMKAEEKIETTRKDEFIVLTFEASKLSGKILICEILSESIIMQK